MSDLSANRLAREKSPYLLQHAHNPVDWYPFGDEALARAKAENLPIFLSIGYATCHWCHVMERECFENEAVAAVMNARYVNVKVDREERPDVDQIYMQALVRMTGQGGWPLNMWLTPDLEPFYGGTYFPPEARYGRPGFVTVLTTLADVFRDRHDEVKAEAEKMVARIAATSSEILDEIPEGLVTAACAQLSHSFDVEWGGFGGAPKFPRPGSLQLLAHRAARDGNADALHQLDHTLEMMWRGGLYDHVGGGFARYSTDAKWLVPHFEKMLYDNALLIESYLDGYLLTGNEIHAHVVRDVLAFVAREMTHEDGGFFSAQDADSEGVEGKFYVLTLAELEEALGEDAERAARIFGASAHGNFEGSNILHLPETLSELAVNESLSIPELLAFYARTRERLYTWREQRVRPLLDDKILASWNGLMIHACARAGAVLAEPTFIEAALRAARFVEENLVTKGGDLLRRWRDGDARFEASLDDHAFLAQGYLGLFEATGDARWLARSLALVAECRNRFAALDGGFYFAEQRDDLLVRLKESDDNAVPSGNGVMALLLGRLGALLQDEALRDEARATIRTFAARIRQVPQAFASLVMAAEEASEFPRTLSILGTPGSEDFEALLVAAHRACLPGRVVIPIVAGKESELVALGVSVERQGDGVNHAARAILCEDGACRPFEPEAAG